MPQVDPTPHELWHHITQISMIGCKICEAEANNKEYFVSNKLDQMDIISALRNIQRELYVDDNTSNHDVWHKLDNVESMIEKLIFELNSKGIVGDSNG